MSYEELSLKGFINEIKEVSGGPHPRKFCFVLGAGASLSSGIKSGQELVTMWDTELQIRNEKSHIKWKEDLNITEENKYSFYSKFYERRFQRQQSLSPKIQDIMVSWELPCMKWRNMKKRKWRRGRRQSLSLKMQAIIIV